MLRRAVSVALLTLLAAGCGTTPRTEIMIIVEADEGVRLDATKLRFEVWGRSAESTDFGIAASDVFYPQSGEALTFPRRFGVVPNANDASRFARFSGLRSLCFLAASHRDRHAKRDHWLP